MAFVNQTALNLVVKTQYQSQEITKLRADLDKVNKELKANAVSFQNSEKRVRDLERELGRLGRQAQAAGRRLSTLGTRGNALRNTFLNLRRIVFVVSGAMATIGVGFSLRRVVTTLSDFGKEMSAVAAVTRATTEQLDLLSSVARRLGATTIFRAPEVAQGMRLLAQAGFDLNEVISAIPGTLALATAGATDLATATNIVSAAVRGFGLNAGDAGEVADTLAVVASKSNTTITDLGEALKFVSAAARSANQDYKEIASALGALADVGIRGTLAGTGLRRVLIGLVNPTKQGERAVARLTRASNGLGVTMEELDPRTNKLSKILSTFADASLGASEAFDLFGLRGGPAALALTLMQEKFEELNKAIAEGRGRAEEMAAIMSGNLFGDIKLANSAIDELILGTNGLNESLRDGVQFITAVIQAFNGTLSPTNKFFKEALRVKAGLEEAGKVLRIVIDNLTELALTLGAIGLAAFIANVLALAAAIRTAASAAVIFRFALAATGLGAVIALLGTATVAWLRYKDASSASDQDLQDKFLTEQGVRLETMIARVNALSDVNDRIAALQEVESFGKQISLDIKKLEEDAAVARVALEGLIELEKQAGSLNETENKQLADNQKIFQEAQAQIEVLQGFIKEIETNPVLISVRLDREALNEESKKVAEFQRKLQEAITTASQAAGVDFSKADKSIGNLKAKVILTEDLLKRLEAGDPEVSVSDIKAARKEFDLFASLDLDPRGVEKLTLAYDTFTEAISKARSAIKSLRESPTVDEGEIRRTELLLESYEGLRRSVKKRLDQNEELRADAREFQQREQAAQEAINAASAAIKRQQTALRNYNEMLEKVNRTTDSNRFLMQANAKEANSLKEAFKLLDLGLKAGITDFQKLERDALTVFNAFEKLRLETEAYQNTLEQGFNSAAQEFIDTARDMTAQGRAIFDTFFGGLREQFVSFTVDGEGDLKELGKAIQREIVGQTFDRGISFALESAGLGDLGKSGDQLIAARIEELKNTQTLAIDNNTTQIRSAIETQTQTLVSALSGKGVEAVAAAAPSVTPSASTGGKTDTADTGFTFSKALGYGTQALGLGLFAGSLIAPFFKNGGISHAGGEPGLLSAGSFRHAKHFNRGGVTIGSPNGIPAILHPNEAVVPLDPASRIPLKVENGRMVVPLPGVNREIKVAAPRFLEGFNPGPGSIFGASGSGAQILSSTGGTQFGGAIPSSVTSFGNSLQPGFNLGGLLGGLSAFTTAVGLVFQILNLFSSAGELSGPPQVSVIGQTVTRRGLGLNPEAQGDDPSQQIGPIIAAAQSVLGAGSISQASLARFAAPRAPQAQDVDTTGANLGTIGRSLSPNFLEGSFASDLLSQASGAAGSSLFGPGRVRFGAFAEGGVISRPTLALMGERRPEAVIPLSGGNVPVQLSSPPANPVAPIISTVNINIVTKDADSFRAAENQVASVTAASLQRALSRNS